MKLWRISEATSPVGIHQKSMTCRVGEGGGGGGKLGWPQLRSGFCIKAKC